MRRGRADGDPAFLGALTLPAFLPALVSSRRLWALLNFLVPDVFASSEQFDEVCVCVCVWIQE